MTSIPLTHTAADLPQPMSLYLQMVTWSFTLFQSARIIAYLPTIWAVILSGHSEEHSLLTWATWLGANLTMTCWMFEQTGRTLTKAVMINICNTTMCFVTLLVIAAHRA